MKLHPIIQEDIEAVTKIISKKIKAFEGTDVVITGANGMLARYLVYALLYANDTLLKKKCTLHLVTRSKNKRFGKRTDIHYIHADMATDRLSDIPADYIIHAASKAAPKIYSKHMLDTLLTNIKGTLTVFDAVTPQTKSILYFSSGEIYGDPPEGTRLTEEYVGAIDHLNERSCYVEGKRAGETICMNYFREKGYPVKIARIFHTFGPGLNLEDGRVFSDFIRDGLHYRDINVKGNKNLKRSLLYIQDATIMFFLILLSDKNGEVYNVAHDTNSVTVDEFARSICAEFNNHYTAKLHVTYQKSSTDIYQNAPHTVVADSTKFSRDFGFTPRVSLSDAIRRTVRYYLPHV